MSPHVPQGSVHTLSHKYRVIPAKVVKNSGGVILYCRATHFEASAGTLLLAGLQQVAEGVHLDTEGEPSALQDGQSGASLCDLYKAYKKRDGEALAQWVGSLRQAYYPNFAKMYEVGSWHWYAPEVDTGTGVRTPTGKYGARYPGAAGVFQGACGVVLCSGSQVHTMGLHMLRPVAVGRLSYSSGHTCAQWLLFVFAGSEADDGGDTTDESGGVDADGLGSEPSDEGSSGGHSWRTAPEPSWENDGSPGSQGLAVCTRTRRRAAAHQSPPAPAPATGSVGGPHQARTGVCLVHAFPSLPVAFSMRVCCLPPHLRFGYSVSAH